MVNEDNGTVFVCVERDMVTQDNLTVPVSLFTTGTADSKTTNYIDMQYLWNIHSLFSYQTELMQLKSWICEESMPSFRNTK